MSDHGFYFGEKQHWEKGTLWEEATNCLLMFLAPGVTQSNQGCMRPVTVLDVDPTLIDLLGIPVPPNCTTGASIHMHGSTRRIMEIIRP